MRAVVMEIDNKVTVLTKDGRFRKISKPNYHIEVGMEINIDESANVNFRRIAAIIVIVFLISGFGVSAYAYYTPYGYINVDINPSIEIVYNRFNRILAINGMNEDGKSVVDNISNYKNKKVETILGDIIAGSTLDNNDEVNVLLTFDKLEEETIDNVKQSLGENDNVNIYEIELPKSEYEKVVKSDSLSPGKATLIEKIKKNNPSYKNEKLEQKTIKELFQIVDKKNNNNKHKEKNKNSNNDSNENSKKNNNNGEKLNNNGGKIYQKNSNSKETSTKDIIKQKVLKEEDKLQKNVEVQSNNKKSIEDTKDNKDQGKHIGQPQNNKKNNDSIKGNGNTYNKNKNNKNNKKNK